MYTSRLCSSARIWRPGAHLAPGAYQTCQTRSDLSDPIRPSAHLAPRHSSARRRLSGAPALIWRSGAYLALWRSGALALLSAPPKAIRRFGALLAQEFAIVLGFLSLHTEAVSIQAKLSLSLNTDDHRDLYFDDLIFSKSFFNCQW